MNAHGKPQPMAHLAGTTALERSGGDRNAAFTRQGQLELGERATCSTSNVQPRKGSVPILVLRPLNPTRE
jgi:hypothetical protein